MIYSLRAYTLLLAATTAAAASSYLPLCVCDNFKNGEVKVGDEACFTQGASDVTTCTLPTRPFIPLVDDGCTATSSRCKVSYVTPVFPVCDCDSYVNGASPTDEAVCQKFDFTCHPRSYT